MTRAQPFSITLILALGSPLLCQTLDQQIAAARADLATAKAQLAPKIAPLIINTDFRFWMSAALFSDLSGTVNQLPADSRTVRFQSTDTTGQLKNSNGGALGCGWYVELDSPQGLRAGAILSALSLSLIPAALNATVHVSLGAEADMHGHIKAPPSPICWPPFDCKCPAGGGFGIHTPVRAPTKEQDFGLTGSILSTNGAWFSTDLKVTQPDKVTETFDVVLLWPGGSLKIGIPSETDLPKDPLVSQSLRAPLISTVELKSAPPFSINRSFTVEVNPKQVTSDTNGLQVLGDIHFAAQ